MPTSCKLFLPKHLFTEKTRQKCIQNDSVCVTFLDPSNFVHPSLYDDGEVTISDCKPEIIIENYPTESLPNSDSDKPIMDLNPIEQILNEHQNRFKSRHLTLQQLLCQPALNDFGELARKAIYEFFPLTYYGRLLNTRITYLYSPIANRTENTENATCSIRITFRVHHDDCIYPTWVDWQTPAEALKKGATKNEVKALRKEWINKGYPRRHPDTYLAPIPIFDEETIEKLRTIYAIFCARDIQNWIVSGNTPPQLQNDD